MDNSLSGSNSVVECHLAKVKVASSNLVSRSKSFGSRAVQSSASFSGSSCGAIDVDFSIAPHNSVSIIDLTLFEAA